jgi:hypothetical protein
MEMMLRQPDRIEAHLFSVSGLLDDRVQAAGAIRMIGWTERREIKYSKAHFVAMRIN